MNELISMEEAIKIISDNASRGPVVYKNLIEAVDECIAENVVADRPLPPFNRSAMDGYAMKSSEFPGPNIPCPITDTLFAGEDKEVIIEPKSCIKIMTGAPVPPSLDIVIPFEDGVQEGDTVHFQINKIKPWQNIARKGEDAEEGDVLIQSGTILSNTAMGIAAAVGHTPVQVYPKPTVAILATGNEIIPIEQVAMPFQIRNSNSFTLYSLLYYLKIEPIFHSIVSDDEESLRKAIRKGLQANVLIVTGGFAKGEKDIVPQILRELGVKELIHGIKVKPGKPVWFGTLSANHAVFGLPGNPVSVQASFKAFVEPYIRKTMGLPNLMPLFLPLAQPINKKHDRAETVIAQMVMENGQTKLEKVAYHGSGDYVNIQGSHGFFIQKAEQQKLDAGMIVEFYPWKNFL